MRISDWSSDVCSSDLRELGQALARLGVKTCIVNRSGNLGGLTDPEVKASALAAFQSELDVRLNTQIVAVRLVDEQVEVRFQTEGQPEATERYDYLLVAAGRRPKARKSVAEGNSGAVCVDLGGRRIIKK